MLFVALLIIGSLVALQELKFEVRRDREEEMIHRGVQYARAVRKYYKKFGTYPPTLEAMENTQNMRFLRKRYKDPVTGKDFKVLRMTDVQLLLSPAIGAQGIASLGGALGQNGAAGQNAALNGLNQAQIASYMANQAALSANNSNPFASANSNNNSQTSAQGNSGAGAGQGGDSSSNNSGNSSNGQTGDNSNQNQGQTQNQNSNSPFVSASGQPQGGTFGGAPIVGVASTSKKETIRIFAKKNHYNDWQFVYDPNSDRGGLLNTPMQPNLQQGLNGAVPAGGQSNTQGSGNSNGTSNPFSNSFGNNNQNGAGNSNNNLNAQPQN